MRAASVGAGIVALAAGLLVGSSACSLDCLRKVNAVDDGTYEIVESEDRPELLGAVVEIRDELVEISFTDVDGNDWVVSYTVVD